MNFFHGRHVAAYTPVKFDRHFAIHCETYVFDHLSVTQFHNQNFVHSFCRFG